MARDPAACTAVAAEATAAPAHNTHEDTSGGSGGSGLTCGTAVDGDTTGDGQIDSVALDTNGDGQIDTVRPLDFAPQASSQHMHASL